MTSASTPRFVVDLAVIALSAVATELTRIPIMKRGTYVKRIGGKPVRFSFTAAAIADVIANFRKSPQDVVIDYEHASMRPDIAMGEAVPAAGWVKEIEDGPDADGVLWGRVEFTEAARERIQKKEVRYVSPEFEPGALDKSTGVPQGLTLRAVALTNRPFLDAMPALALSDAWEEIDGGDAVDAAVEEKTTVKITNIALTDNRRVKVTLDDGAELISDMAIEASPTVLRLSDVGRDDKGRYAFSSLDGKLAAGVVVDGEVIHAMRAQDAIEGALTKGQIMPAHREMYERMALSDLPAFERFLATAPVVVPMEELGTGTVRCSHLTLSALDQVDAEIDPLVQGKIQASGGKLDYGQAWTLVLGERPDLARRRKAGMR